MNKEDYLKLGDEQKATYRSERKLRDEEERKKELEALNKFRADNKEFVDTRILPHLNKDARALFSFKYDDVVLQMTIGAGPNYTRCFVLLQYFGTVIKAGEDRDVKIMSFIDSVNYLAERKHILYGIMCCGILKFTDGSGDELLKLYCYSHLDFQTLNRILEERGLIAGFYTEGSLPK